MGMRIASYPTEMCAHRQCSMHFVKSSDSEIFEFSDNSKLSISPEKVIPKIRQTGPLIMCYKRLMYSKNQADSFL